MSVVVRPSQIRFQSVLQQLTFTAVRRPERSETSDWLQNDEVMRGRALSRCSAV